MQNTTFAVEAGSHLHIHTCNGALVIHSWEEAYIALNGSPSTVIEQNGDTFTLQNQNGDLQLHVPNHLAISISEHTGNIEVQNVRTLTIAVAKGRVAAESISETVHLRDILGPISVNRANALTIERDEQPRNWWRALTRPIDRAISVDNTAVIVIAEAHSDLRISNAQHAEIYGVGGDAEIEHISGSLRVDAVGGNATLNDIAQLYLGSVGGNASIQAITSVNKLDSIGGNLSLHTQQFAAHRNITINVGGNATLALPDEANLSIRAIFGGALYQANTRIQLMAMANLTYGTGDAAFQLTTGGDLYLQGGNPQIGSLFGGGRAASRAPRPTARHVPSLLANADQARSTILHLVASGKLSPEEAEQQLDALEYARS